MQVHRGFDKLEGIKNPVVTTGTFDGVHLGHNVILSRLNKLAEDIDGESVLVTFHPHPRKVLYPETAGKELVLINTQREKVEQLAATGIDHVIIVEFTKEFAKTTSKDFVEKLLLGKLGAKKIIVGFNHHFGHNKEGDYNYLYDMTTDHDFAVEEIPEQDLENETVSSTIIRKALQDGRIQRANAYLDHYFICMGTLLHGSEKCRTVGFPTFELDIEEDEKLIPPAGVYAVSVECKNQRLKGMLNINLPKDEEQQAMQVHIFNYDSSLKFKGEIAKICFHKRMRDELIITTPEQFQAQLANDRKEIQELIY